MKSSLVPKREQELLRIVKDPTLFAEAMLGHQVWSRQNDILQSVAKHSRTAVKACHASGKTFTAAAAALWWIAHRPNGIVVTTAPTWGQVERVIWGEIRRLAYEGKIRFPKPSATALHIEPNRYAIGLSTNDGLRFQGYHGDVLIIIDEAPGVLP